MEMAINDTDRGLRLITLIGRLDTPGAGHIEARFLAAAVQPGNPCVVDLSQVEFIASIGVRMLISAARGLARKEVKLALYVPEGLVNDVLQSVSLSEIVPIRPDMDGAIAAVLP